MCSLAVRVGRNPNVLFSTQVWRRNGLGVLKRPSGLASIHLICGFEKGNHGVIGLVIHNAIITGWGSWILFISYPFLILDRERKRDGDGKTSLIFVFLPAYIYIYILKTLR